ncbi:MAG: phospholipase effector Tle1 domain-containing protein [Microcystis sp.]
MAEQRSVLKFNGIDDYMELSGGFLDIDQSITITFWAKGENNLATETTLLEAVNRDNNRVLHITLPWGDPVKPAIFWDAGNEEGFDRIEKKVKLKDYSDWTHWAFVKNATTGRMLIYRNGIVWHRGNGHNRALTGIEKIILGASINPAHYWQGCLAEFSLWNQALSQEEIQKTMYQSPGFDDLGLVTYLSLNGSAEDQTSYGNHGVLYGTTWQLDSLPSKPTSIPKSKTQTSSKARRNAKRITMVNEIFNSLEEEEVIEQDAPAEHQEPSPKENPESTIITEEADLPNHESNEIEEITETAISAPAILTYSSQKKRLIICCDGSWEDSVSAAPTNVVKFAASIKHIAEDQTPQIIFLSGYGSPEDNEFIKNLGNETFGWVLDQMIQDAYRFLVLNYNPTSEDEIYLLGFSRGAYIVRCLASFIDKCGILKRSKIEEIPQAYQLYRDHTVSSDSAKARQFRAANAKKIETEKEDFQERIPVKMLGCWDTVGNFGIPDLTPWFPLAKFYHKKYEFSNTKLSPIIQNAFQAVAIDEKRKNFPSTPIKANTENPEQVVKEVLFVGEHSCLGGGKKEYQGLSDYPLQWMMNQAKQLGLEINSLPPESDEFPIKLDPTIKFDNTVKGLAALGGEEWRTFNAKVVTVHHSVVKRLKAFPDYRPKSLEPFLQALLNSDQQTD